MDNLIICKRCGSNACYTQQVSQEVETNMCFGCGFTTSTLMKTESEPVKATLQNSPELYKALMFTDKDDHVWFPATISMPNQGMVFIDGTSLEDWKWAAVKSIPLGKKDKKLNKDQTHKMDMANVKYFAQNDFMTALEVIGFYDAQ